MYYKSNYKSVVVYCTKMCIRFATCFAMLHGMFLHSTLKYDKNTVSYHCLFSPDFQIKGIIWSSFLKKSLLKIMEKWNGKNDTVTKNAGKVGGHFCIYILFGAETHCTFKNIMNKTRTDTGYSGRLRCGAEIIHDRQCEH